MGDNRISIIADVVRDTYGDDAITAARRQVEAADGASREDWIAILDRLRDPSGLTGV